MNYQEIKAEIARARTLIAKKEFAAADMIIRACARGGMVQNDLEFLLSKNDIQTMRKWVRLHKGILT